MFSTRILRISHFYTGKCSFGARNALKYTIVLISLKYTIALISSFFGFYRQVASSSNVGGAYLCFLNGGLNYQIEHHLFPRYCIPLTIVFNFYTMRTMILTYNLSRIQHSHYPKIAPIVKEFCLSRGIPYHHFPTVFENFKSCVDHLYVMGTTA